MRLTFCSLSLAVHAGAWSATPRIQARASLTSERATVLSGGAANPPLTLLVTVEIKEDRIDEFLAAMAIDAAGSRTEDGCVRFDLLRDQAASNKFHFVEVYDLGKYPCADCTIVSQPEWRNSTAARPAVRRRRRLMRGRIVVHRDAVEVHKATSHYKAWADFKASGGVLSQTVSKCDAIDFTG